MSDIIISLIVIAVLSCSVGYIIYAKKKGAKCIGCPASGGTCHCHCHQFDEEE